jgi:chromosome segregation ATPase
LDPVISQDAESIAAEFQNLKADLLELKSLIANYKQKTHALSAELQIWQASLQDSEQELALLERSFQTQSLTLQEQRIQLSELSDGLSVLSAQYQSCLRLSHAKTGIIISLGVAIVAVGVYAILK